MLSLEPTDLHFEAMLSLSVPYVFFGCQVFLYYINLLLETYIMTLLFMKLAWRQWHSQIPQIVLFAMELAWNIFLVACCKSYQ